MKLKYLFSPSFYQFIFLRLRNGYDQYLLVQQLIAKSQSCRIANDIKLVGVQNINLGLGCKIDKHTYLNAGGIEQYGHDGSIILEDEIIIAHGTMLYAGGGIIKIGKRSRVGIGCMITAMHEDPHINPDVATSQHTHVFEEVIIGQCCLIAGGAIILGGTELGDNCIVGAGAVVKGKYPNNTTLVGNPARAIPRLGFDKKE
ncbi:MAG: acyltransferase [Bacteroidota bacterium]|nr:acyltransferase [Bacteroidota bacterium]